MSNSNEGSFYFGISDRKIHICFFEIGESQYKETLNFDIPDSISNDLNFGIILNLLKKNIRNIEKNLGFFLNSGNISIHSNSYQSIVFSIKNIFDEKKLDNKVVTDLVQSGIKYFDDYNKKLKVIHIIINKYNIDGKVYNFLPNDIKFKKIILEIEIITLDKYLIQKVKKLFKECKIKINKIVSFEYAKKFLNDEKDLTMCISAKKVINGVNKSEVLIREDYQQRVDIFDKIFKFFD